MRKTVIRADICSAFLSTVGNIHLAYIPENAPIQNANLFILKVETIFYSRQLIACCNRVMLVGKTLPMIRRRKTKVGNVGPGRGRAILTPAMLAMLRNAKVGLPLKAGLHGRAAHGGAEHTIVALRRRGYLNGNEITAEGAKALKLKEDC